MNHLSIRFLIGLSSSIDATISGSEEGTSPTLANARADRAIAILSTHCPAFSSHRGVGYWQGDPEPNLVVEVIVEIIDEVSSWYGEPLNPPTEEAARGRAQSIAGKLALALNQESVALVVGPVRFTLEGPHATES